MGITVQNTDENSSSLCCRDGAGGRQVIAAENWKEVSPAMAPPLSLCFLATSSVRSFLHTTSALKPMNHGVELLKSRGQNTPFFKLCVSNILSHWQESDQDIWNI